MRWILFIEIFGLSESKMVSILTNGKNEKKKHCDVSLSAKKKPSSVYCQRCRNTSVRSFPSHMLAVQIIGLILPCNCFLFQTGIRDMGSREMQLLQYTAKCFQHLSVPGSSTCSVTDIYYLLRIYADRSWRNWGSVFHSFNMWKKSKWYVKHKGGFFL